MIFVKIAIFSKTIKIENVVDWTNYTLFTAFLKSTFHFEHFEKKGEPHSLCISETIDGERSAYVNV